MTETGELKSMLTSYTVQDNALVQSTKHKVESYNKYQETLHEYKTIKEELFQVQRKHKALNAELAELLTMKDHLHNLQVAPNSKISDTRKEILNTYQAMAKDSDDFVNAVTATIKSVENLGIEFDETAIQGNKCDCSEKIRALSKEINEKESEYNSLMESMETQLMTREEPNPLKEIFKDADLVQMEKEVFESEQHLMILIKNIEFLKEKNQESRMQQAEFEASWD